MKNLLDKLDRIPLIVKAVLIILALILLGIGLVVSSRENHSAPSKTTSSSSYSSREKGVEEARRLVEDLEENPTQEKIETARLAVEKLSNRDQRKQLLDRIQEVAFKLESSTEVTNSLSRSEEQGTTIQEGATAPSSSNAPSVYVDSQGRTYTSDQVYTDANTGETYVQ